MKLASVLGLKTEMISKARTAFVASEVAIGRSPAQLARILSARGARKPLRSVAASRPTAAVRVP